MRKAAVFMLALLLMLGMACPGSAQEFTGFTARRTKFRNLAAGVDYSVYRLMSKTSDKGQKLFVLDVRPDQNSKLMLHYAVENGHVYESRKRVTQYVNQEKRRDAVILAATNGDFFDTSCGGPLGHSMREGRWITAGEFPEGYALGIKEDGTAVIGQPRVRLSLYAERNGETILEGEKINALNALRGDVTAKESSPNNAFMARKDNDLVLYTADWSASTHAHDGGVEVRVAVNGKVRTGEILQGKVTEINDENAVTWKRTKSEPLGMTLNERSVVLSGIGLGADILHALEIGDEIHITCEADAAFDGAVTVAGGGRPDKGPLLVENGAITSIDQSVADDAVTFYARNPRTVFGIRADGSYFLLVIEKNHDGSYGMTIEQTQQAALDLGAVTALNLDGGSSSAMVVRSQSTFKLVSLTTSSGQEIAVGSALILYEKK